MDMDSPEMKKAAIIERCVAWVKKQPEDQQHYFCEHGRYWGAKGALRFMSPCCK